jgi:hypothetical protein
MNSLSASVHDPICSLFWTYSVSVMAQGQKAIAIIPTSKYPWGGPGEEATMAEIYTRLGDAYHAIPILNRLLQLPIGSLGLRRHC